jgi:hypothetical protein
VVVKMDIMNLMKWIVMFVTSVVLLVTIVTFV